MDRSQTGVEILVLTADHPLRAEIIGAIHGDPDLMARVWREAKSRVTEHPGRTWVVAMRAGDPLPLAWCGWEPAAAWSGVELKLVASYHRDRTGDFYPAVFLERHRQTRHLSAETFIFADPPSLLALHEAHGWARAGEEGTDPEGDPPHHWMRLVRPADRPGPRGLLVRNGRLVHTCRLPADLPAATSSAQCRACLTT